MKKQFLIFLISLICIGSYAQQISINVRLLGGSERLYFGNSHAWMRSHGYRYDQRGYYTGHNRRIYPNRREYYNAQHKRWSKTRSNNRKYQYNNKSRHSNGRGNNHNDNNGRKGKK